MRIRFLAVALCALLMSETATAQQINPSLLPEDVAQFISRWEECRHFAGEEPYDKGRAEELWKAIEKLNCEGIEEDFDHLKHAYINNSRATRALEKIKSNYY